MRSASPLIAAGLALALASPALAQGAGSPTSPGGGAESLPTTSQPPTTSETAPPSSAPSQPAAPSAQGSGAPASATAPGAAGQSSAPASFTVGETVKDNTGASIGSITSLTGSGDSQMAVIKMGDQSFQVQTNRLGSADGAAEINMTKAQIQGMLKGGASK